MDDWLIDDEIFEYFEKMWGVYIVDRFVMYYNKKCVRFNLKYWCLNIECVDVFNVCWKGENNWLVLFLNLIIKVINKFVVDKVKVILIVLEWKLVLFWLILYDGKKFKSFVLFWEYLLEKRLIIYGKSKKLVFDKFFLDFKMVVFNIKF